VRVCRAKNMMLKFESNECEFKFISATAMKSLENKLNSSDLF